MTGVAGGNSEKQSSEGVHKHTSYLTTATDIRHQRQVKFGRHVKFGRLVKFGTEIIWYLMEASFVHGSPGSLIDG